MNDSGKETACLLYCCVFSLLHHFVFFIIFILFLCNAVLHYSVWFVQMKHNALIRNKSFNEIMFFNGNTETATTKNRMIRLGGGAVGVGSKCNGMRERRPKFFFVQYDNADTDDIRRNNQTVKLELNLTAVEKFLSITVTLFCVQYNFCMFTYIHVCVFVCEHCAVCTMHYIYISLECISIVQSLQTLTPAACNDAFKMGKREKEKKQRDEPPCKPTLASDVLREIRAMTELSI